MFSFCVSKPFSTLLKSKKIHVTVRLSTFLGAEPKCGLRDFLLNFSLTWTSQLYMQAAASISGLVETLSDSESDLSNQDLTDSSTTDNFFLTGLLDELKISFSYSDQVCSFLKTTGLSYLLCL